MDSVSRLWVVECDNLPVGTWISGLESMRVKEKLSVVSICGAQYHEAKLRVNCPKNKIKQ